MADTWSGAIIYEWIQEMNQYGLISYGAQQDSSVNEGSSILQGFAHAVSTEGFANHSIDSFDRVLPHPSTLILTISRVVGLPSIPQASILQLMLRLSRPLLPLAPHPRSVQALGQWILARPCRPWAKQHFQV